MGLNVLAQDSTIRVWRDQTMYYRGSIGLIGLKAIHLYKSLSTVYIEMVPVPNWYGRPPALRHKHPFPVGTLPLRPF